MKFINSRKVSFGSLGLVVSLFGVSVEGAIAQNLRSDRHISDQEIQSLIDSSQLSRVVNRVTDRVGLDDRRSQFEINSINQFVSAWQKADPAIASFLGDWRAYEESLEIYPSTVQGQVCVVREYFAGSREGTKRLLNMGKVTSDRLMTDGDLGKKIFVKRRGILQKPSDSEFPNQKVEYIGMFGSVKGKNDFSAYVFPRKLKAIDDSRFTRSGCTASLPSNNQTQTSTQKHPAEVVVSDFYTWYLNNNSHREMLYQKKESFTPNLYRYLDRAIRITQSNNRWSGMLNYDLFSFTQVGSYSFQITSVIPKENSTEVYLNLEVGLRRSRNLQPIKVIVARNGNSWQIDNFYFLSDPAKDYNLLSELVKFNQIQEFQNVPWGNSITTPSVPSSTTPVKPTDAIAKYPTSDNFEKVDRILQASRNPESLVNLKGNQQDQRRKFQKEWESRNPAAAKFLGSWYTGGKSFYVYPSTSKGGTCVITKDNQGNLDLQIGAVLNKELRYGGGKGFFWIDRENIIASRDSNSGDLYPIYATSEVPELSESTISNMESQKCITTLPTAPVATKPLPKNTSGQLLSNENVACTTEFKTLLGQTASAYCKSSQVDSGIIFDDIKVTKNADRSVKLELRMFNRGSAEGFVEVYDSNKKLQDIKIIDGNKPPTGLLQSSYGLFVEVPASVFSRYPLGDDRRSLKEQILDVTIPAGGYVQITKSSNFAVNYNTAMLLLEISQLTGGDPGFIQEASTKKFLVGFAKEVSSEATINIFKGEVNIQSIASMEFVDKKKLAEVFQKLVRYSASIEKEPSKNPIFSGFSDVILTTGNIGLEQALDVVVPGLGSLSRNVRNGGDSLNVAARAIDIKNSIAADRKATIIFRNPL